MAEKDWLDKFHDSTEILYNVAQDLTTIASALDMVGNEKLSDTLYDLSRLIYKSRKQIDSAISEKMTIDVDQSREMTGTVLNLALSNVFKETK